MTIACGLSPLVIAHVELPPKIDKLLRDIFDELRWRNAGFRSRLLYLLAMLIDTGQKENLVAFEPMIARNYVSQHFFVSVTDVRRRVGVIDRCGDVERFRHRRDKLADTRAKRNPVVARQNVDLAQRLANPAIL